MRLPSVVVVVGLSLACGGGHSTPPPGPDGAVAYFHCTVALHDPLEVPDPDGANLAVGDLDGDHRVDLVTTHPRTDQIAVLLSQPQGGFAPAVAYPTGHLPGAVQAADLDGDGDLDLAISDGGADSVTVLANDGHGTFTAAGTYPTGAGAGALAIADVTGDGKLDLVVADRGSNIPDGNGGYTSTITILANTGTGAFAAAGTITTDQTPEAVIAADLDHDGKLDVVDVSGVTSNVCVHRNLGGSFAPRQCTSADAPDGVVAADFDGDGVLDLAVSNFIGLPTFARVQVLRGHGDGTFDPAVGYQTADIQHAIAAGDLDGDGKPDLVVPDNWDATVSVLINRGDGTFADPVSYAGGGLYGSQIALADVDGDSHLDVAVVAGTVNVLSGHGDGTLEAQRVYPVGDQPTSGALADLDGDGYTDVLVAPGGSMFHRNDQLRILYGTGPGTFTVVGIPSPNPMVVAAADVTGDHQADIVVGDGGDALSVLVNQGGRMFAAQGTISVGATPRALAFADVDGDHRADLLIAAADGIHVALGTSSGALAMPTLLATGGDTTSVAAADIDNDGHLDLVAAVPSLGIATFRGHGDGTFAAPAMLPAGAMPTQVATGNVVDAHAIDIVTRDPSTNTIGVLRGHGDGSFDPIAQYPAASGATSFALGDVTGDHRPDVVVTISANPNQRRYVVQILQNHGDGTLELQSSHVTGVQPIDVMLGDFDRDGNNDLAILDQGAGANGWTGTVGVLLETCQPVN